MEIDEIRKLIRLMEEAGLTELEIEDRGGKVRLVRGQALAGRDSNPESNSADEAMRVPGVRGAHPAEALDSRGGRAPAAGTTTITSPMVGTFYRAPAPDAACFVNVGDVVQVGQVVCIIEARKMMNEIHAETAGRIMSIVAENGAPVEYGSPLFLVELVE
jgi:acetyl-CoA carboxylase biotin carboxyl carrier protein